MIRINYKGILLFFLVSQIAGQSIIMIGHYFNMQDAAIGLGLITIALRIFYGLMVEDWFNVITIEE